MEKVYYHASTQILEITQSRLNDALGTEHGGLNSSAYYTKVVPTGVITRERSNCSFESNVFLPDMVSLAVTGTN